MGMIAVDVVLLCDENMTARALEANAELVGRFGSEIVLNRHDRLPHISLAMGCINENQIPSIEQLLAEIAARFPITELCAGRIKTSTNATGQQVSAFELERTARLQRLHEEVMMRLEPYLSRAVTPDMIYDEKVAQTTLDWIKDYAEKSSFEKFWPHVTIGYGRPERKYTPVRFRATELALCHLGNHCTCRRVLASVELRGNR